MINEVNVGVGCKMQDFFSYKDAECHAFQFKENKGVNTINYLDNNSHVDTMTQYEIKKDDTYQIKGRVDNFIKIGIIEK